MNLYLGRTTMDLAQKLMEVLICDNARAVRDRAVKKPGALTENEHANKAMSALLIAYCSMAATRDEPEDWIDKCRAFVSSKDIRDRLIRNMRVRWEKFLEDGII